VPAPKARSIRETLDAGLKTAASGDLSGAAALYESVLERRPNHRGALRSLLAIESGLAERLDRPSNGSHVKRAAELARQLHSGYIDLQPFERELIADALFQDARRLALDGKIERAFGALSDAIAAGYTKTVTLRTDNALERLRSDRRFGPLVSGVEAKRRETVRRVLAAFAPLSFGFQLRDLKDRPVALGDFRGKVVVVHLWGTWCPAGRVEVSHLIELRKTYRARGLEVIGIHFERPYDAVDARTIVQRFVDAQNIPYPCVIGNEAVTNQIADFEGYPSTVFVDRKGKVRALVSGFNLETVFDLDTIAATLTEEGERNVRP
jgi:thiol-disulfide isomerase/thioredoxin